MSFKHPASGVVGNPRGPRLKSVEESLAESPRRRTEFRCTGCGLTSNVSRPDHTHGGKSLWQAIPIEG